jgi:hypothetical protein
VPFNEDWDDAIDYLRNVPEVLAKYGKTAEESDAEWSDWLWYGAPNDSGRSWTTPELPFGPYIFAVRAKDDAGAVTPVLDQVENVRLVDVASRSNGPVFEVSNEFMGLVRTSSCVTPVTVIDLPASVEIVFRWRADASSYGGTVAGYRYGWDIDDLNDPTQWETDLTPFTSAVASAPSRHFYYGTHTFSVEVVDDSGQCARAEIKINIVEFPMERSLLIVDDFPADEDPRQAGWDNPIGGGTLPTDAEHREFWAGMANNVTGFSAAGDIMRVSGDHPFQLAQVGNYKSIIWSAFSDAGTLNPPTLIYQYIQYRRKSTGLTGKREPNVIALFMAAGGHVLITGRQPVSNMISREYAHGSRFPFLTRYDQEGQTSPSKFEGTLTAVGEKSFGYLDLCLESLDYAILDALRRRDESLICSVQLDRPLSIQRVIEDGMRAGIPLQPGFERIELRREATSSGRAYAPDKRSYEAEVYNPQYFSDICIFAPQSRDCFEPIYGLDCPNTSSPCYGQPVAFWTSTYADRLAEVTGAVRARSAVFGFPPVYFTPDQVKPGIEHILFCEWQLDPVTPHVCNH